MNITKLISWFVILLAWALLFRFCKISGEFYPMIIGPGFGGSAGASSDGIRTCRLSVRVRTTAGIKVLARDEFFQSVFPSNRGILANRIFPKSDATLDQIEVIEYLDLLARRATDDAKAVVMDAYWQYEFRPIGDLLNVVPQERESTINLRR